MAEAELRVIAPFAATFELPWQRAFAALSRTLRPYGIGTCRLAIDGSIAAGEVVLASLAWGYHLAPTRWFGLLQRLSTRRAHLINPVELLRWNSVKDYLIALHAMGLPVIPTAAARDPTAEDLNRLRRDFGMEVLVAKPRIGACASGARLLPPGAAPPTGEMLLQPFQPMIALEGEWSLIYLAGRYSHAVRKSPAVGDFRVQAEHGGRTVRTDAPDEAQCAARQILSTIPGGIPPLYARVDLVRSTEGRFRLMELELIEPQLFLNHAPDANAWPAALADALGASSAQYRTRPAYAAAAQVHQANRRSGAIDA